VSSLQGTGAAGLTEFDLTRVTCRRGAVHNGRLFELLRRFRTAELVDSSTLPRLAVDNHSGLR
jgi:hypothetical protein